MTGDIPISRDITCLRQLPEGKMLGEFHVLIDTYFLHNLNVNMKNLMPRRRAAAVPRLGYSMMVPVF